MQIATQQNGIDSRGKSPMAVSLVTVGFGFSIITQDIHGIPFSLLVPKPRLTVHEKKMKPGK